MGIDYAAYLRFVNLTPVHSDTMNGVREYRAPKGYAATGDDVAFCYQFVISASLRLAEAHAHLAHRRGLQATRIQRGSRGKR